MPVSTWWGPASQFLQRWMAATQDGPAHCGLGWKRLFQLTANNSGKETRPGPEAAEKPVASWASCTGSRGRGVRGVEVQALSREGSSPEGQLLRWSPDTSGHHAAEAHVHTGVVSRRVETAMCPQLEVPFKKSPSGSRTEQSSEKHPRWSIESAQILRGKSS